MFFKKLFSDSGEVSFSRTASGIAVICSCVWVSYVVYKNIAIPDLSGIALFIGTLYGLGKVSETIQKIKSVNEGGNGG